MQRIISILIGNNLDATDGEIGKVQDFYFDDHTWTIRYLVVKTGFWLSGRKVLISPQALLNHSWESGIFPVNLTKEQVKHSPDIDTAKPVSRQQEEELTDYYPWQPYWQTAFVPGEVWGIIPSTPVIEPGLIRETEPNRNPVKDPHLRSYQEVKNYHIHASNGAIGHVNDFILDEQTWQISYLVVATHDWFGGRKVLVAVRHIKTIEWETGKLVVDLTVEDIKRGTSIDKWDYIIPEGDKAEFQQHSFQLHKPVKTL
jgi:uncharacterized protein YrrD